MNILIHPHRPAETIANTPMPLIHWYVEIWGSPDELAAVRQLDYCWRDNGACLTFEGRWSPRHAADSITHYESIEELESDLRDNAWKSSPEYHGDDWEYHHTGTPDDAMKRGLEILSGEIQNLGLKPEITIQWIDFCPLAGGL